MHLRSRTRDPLAETNRNIGALAALLALALGAWGCTGSGSEFAGGEKVPAAAVAGQRGQTGEGSSAKRGTARASETANHQEAISSVGRSSEDGASSKKERIVMSEEEWKKKLTPEQYYVCRQKGTEPAFTGKYWKSKKDGTYVCAACGNELFSSETKFDSGTGWPSYWAPIDKDNVKTESDTAFGMVRTEVMCSRCGSHLGHVFDDGPAPTNLRYCINSAALDFHDKKEEPAE